jgi:hypothetical protein
MNYERDERQPPIFKGKRETSTMMNKDNTHTHTHTHTNANQSLDTGGPIAINLQNFPIGKRAQTKLATALSSTKDPKEAITNFQQEHSLHSYLAKSFHTIPTHHVNSMDETALNKDKDNDDDDEDRIIEPIQPESVLTFLQHLNISRYQVHKTIADALKNAIEDEVEKMDKNNSNSKAVLLELLKSAWIFRNIPELRSVFTTLVKKLDQDTPIELLQLLAEKKADGDSLKYKEVVDSLGDKMKRLVWEADWEKYVRGDGVVILADTATSSTSVFTKSNGVRGTLDSSCILMDQIRPEVLKYLNDPNVIEHANLIFTGSIREKKFDTHTRRSNVKKDPKNATSSNSSISGSRNWMALTKQTSTPSVKEKEHHYENTTGSALASLKQITGSRPKLLAALLNVLIAEHGKGVDLEHPENHSKIFAGSAYLPCTLVADILLSFGQLPRQYEEVFLLAQTIDNCVRNGMVSDNDLVQIQLYIKEIYQTDQESLEVKEEEKKKKTTVTISKKTTSSTTAGKDSAVEREWEKKLLRKIIKSAIKAMKDIDPQGLFLNPVTDEIAPGYSKVIKHPMCIRNIEEKATNQRYTSLSQYEGDVQLMFNNCVKYNIGDAGQWFRNEARRQEKKWKGEILSQMQNLYKDEMKKRQMQLDNSIISSPKEQTKIDDEKKKEILLAQQKLVSGNKRKLDADGEQTGAVVVHPLAGTTLKKRKKDSGLVSMPVLVTMLLSDPFFSKLLLDKILRALRSVIKEKSLPLIHDTFPSVIQLLHIASFSKWMCATKGKRFSVPDAGLIHQHDDETNNENVSDAFTVLRLQMPLVADLLVEVDTDKRMSPGGDLEGISHIPSSTEYKIPKSTFRVALDLLECSLVHVLQPGMSNSSSLARQCQRLFIAINHLSESNMANEMPFFVSLSHVLLKYKAKLPHAIRDLIVNQWIEWIRLNEDRVASMTGAVHHRLIHLLNEWSSFGNILLPRDTMISFMKDIVAAAGSNCKEELSFAHYWRGGSECFGKVKLEYERFLKNIPDERANQFLESFGVQDV